MGPRGPFGPFRRRWGGTPVAGGPASPPATRRAANRAEKVVPTWVLFRRPVVVFLKFTYASTTRPAGLTMTELEVDVQHSPKPGGGGPDAARLVARDDLVARLERSAARKVTVVSAPAGSGKTSLSRAWAAGPGRAHRVAFVPVRQGEQDAQVFWLALLSAVGQACGATGDEPSTATPGFNGRTMAD